MKQVFKEKAWLKILIPMLVVGLLAIFASDLSRYLPRLEAWVRAQGPMAPLVFGLLVTFLSMAFFSTDVLCFAAGALFGIGLGFFLSATGLLAGASLMFLLARYGLRGALHRHLSRYPKFQGLNGVLKNFSWKILFILRIAPFPFAPLSYFLGITKVSFQKYFFTVFGTMGTVLLGVYYGNMANHITQWAGNTREFHPVKDAVRIAGLILTVALFWWLTRYAKRVLKEGAIGPKNTSEPAHEKAPGKI